MSCRSLLCRICCVVLCYFVSRRVALCFVHSLYVVVIPYLKLAYFKTFFVFATGVTMASKKSWSEAQLVRSIRKARDITFPMDAFPTAVMEWLTALAFSVNTRPEFVLIAAISVVSTLMGPKTKLRIRKRYSEPCNLFTVCLSEHGAGKSQAFDIAVEL